MTDDEKVLFDELIVSAGTLATMAEQAGDILSVDFQNVVTEPVAAVREVLARCPSPGEVAWDGTLLESQVDVTYLEHDGRVFDDEMDPTIGKKVAVKLIHRPTGIGTESRSKNKREDNYRVAWRALEGLVAREWARRS